MTQTPFQSSTVMADIHTPQMNNITRWEYFSRYIPTWTQLRQNRSYAMVTAVIGILLLINAPLLAPFAFAAAAYFWTTSGLQNFILTSRRRLIIAD